MIQINKTLVAFLFIIFIFITGFFINLNQISAYSPPACVPFANILVASYQQGNFIDGFMVNRKNNWGCGPGDKRPIVNTNDKQIQDAIRVASQDLNINPYGENYSGVYIIETWCLDTRWNDPCKIKQISTNPEEIDKYRSEWKEKARAELLTYVTPILLYLLVLILIPTWPWFFIKKWPSMHNLLSVLLVLSIVLQIFIVFSFNSINKITYSKIPVKYLLFLSPILVLSIIFQIILLIVKKIRSKRAQIPQINQQ